MDGDLIDELRQQRSGDGVDVAVVLEVLDELIGAIGSGAVIERGFQPIDAFLQIRLFLLIFLLVEQILILVEDAGFVVGVEVCHQGGDLFQLAFLPVQLNRDFFGSAV